MKRAHALQLASMSFGYYTCLQDEEEPRGPTFRLSEDQLNDLLLGASINGQLAEVKRLVSAGANPRGRNEDCLCWAARYGRLEVMQYLVSLGADIQARDGYCIYIAVYHGHGDVVRYLVSIGADTCKIGYKAVRISFAWGHVAIVRYLAALGVKIADNGGMKIADFGDLEPPGSRPRNRFVRYLMSIGVSFRRRRRTGDDFIPRPRRNIRGLAAARRVYFGWVPRCYDLRGRAGRRMARRNLAAYRRICEK